MRAFLSLFILLCSHLLMFGANTYLGIYLETLTNYEKRSLDLDCGLRIDSVLSDSPAEKAGLRKNQIILKVNNQKVLTEDFLYSYISNFKPGDKVSILIQDRKSRIVKRVELGNKNKFFAQMNNKRLNSDPFLYLQAKGIPVQSQIAPLFQLPPGILLTNIPNNSRADRFGLNNGDIITEINGVKISGPKQLASYFCSVGCNKTAEIKIFRNGRIFRKKITIEPINAEQNNDVVIIGPHVYDEELFYIQELQKWYQSLPAQSGKKKEEIRRDLKTIEQKIEKIKNQLESAK